MNGQGEGPIDVNHHIEVVNLNHIRLANTTYADVSSEHVTNTLYKDHKEHSGIYIGLNIAIYVGIYIGALQL